MNTVRFNLPAAVVMKGRVFDTMDPLYLRADLAEFELACGLHISVGWEPQCDHHGAFQIVLFRECSLFPKAEYRTRAIHDMKRIVEILAEDHCFDAIDLQSGAGAGQVSPQVFNFSSHHLRQV